VDGGHLASIQRSRTISFVQRAASLTEIPLQYQHLGVDITDAEHSADAAGLQRLASHHNASHLNHQATSATGAWQSGDAGVAAMR
jgi:hypothetical protein